MYKYTLVPQAFFEGDGYKILSELVQLDEADKINHKELPEFKAVLVYAYKGEDCVCEVASVLDKLSHIKDFNKIGAKYADGYIHIAIATGSKLLLCNSFQASDNVTALYFIFAVLQKFQINPEVSTIYFAGEDFQMKSELFRYFKGVESL